MTAASPASGARRLTLEAWTTLPDEEPGEWVDGWLVEEEVATPIEIWREVERLDGEP
jgi:hypothetical protein